ncbi:MAG TPA: hypothetical protein VMT91_07785 [Anaerolineales bacterium]|nr:hypothetical protein [Anaerolineales bacterium]
MNAILRPGSRQAIQAWRGNIPGKPVCQAGTTYGRRSISGRIS